MFCFVLWQFSVSFLGFCLIVVFLVGIVGSVFVDCVCVVSVFCDDEYFVVVVDSFVFVVVDSCVVVVVVVVVVWLFCL